jgi:hypothetical protein
MHNYFFIGVKELKEMYKCCPHQDNLKIVEAALILYEHKDGDVTFSGWTPEDEKALHKMCSYLQIKICSVGWVGEECTVAVGESYTRLFLRELRR